jgi:hypothetical protein
VITQYLARSFALALAVTAAAQPAPSEKPADPTDTPNLTDPSLRDVVDRQSTRPAPKGPIQPTKPASPAPTDPNPPAPAKPASSPIPGLPAEAPGLSARRFYPEGTFLSRRRGSLFKASTGDLVFIPERDRKGKGESPMVLLPCQTLARLEASPDVATPNTTVILSGEVFVYFDRQYLLPSAFAFGTTPKLSPTADQPASTPSTQPSTQPSTPPASTPITPAAPPANTPPSQLNDPEVADLIRDLEAKRGSAKAIDVPKPADQRKPEDTKEETKAVRPEGTTIVSRRARLSRLPGGQLAATFDGGTTNAGDKPVVFLRCRLVQKLDELAQSRGDDLQLVLSGRTFVYGGRNYILPTLAQVVPAGDVRSLQ